MNVISLNRKKENLTENEWRWNAFWHVVNKRFHHEKVRTISKADLVDMIIETEEVTTQIMQKGKNDE